MSDVDVKKGKVVGSVNIYERQFDENKREYYHNEMYNPIAIILTYEDGSEAIEIRDKERFAFCSWSGDSRDF